MPRKKEPSPHVKSNSKYNKLNTKQYLFRFNLKTDADIIAHMDSLPNKLGYIKQLIRDDIRKEQS